MKYLQSITGTTKGLAKEIKIPLHGRNLIITGQNGVGKTFFLNQINNTITKELLSKIASLSDESYKAKKTFIIRLGSILNQNPELNSIVNHSDLKKLVSLSKSKSAFNVKNNNQFYEISKSILNDIYFSIKSNIKNRNRYTHELNTSKIILESNNYIEHLLPDYILDNRFEKNILSETDDLIYNLEKMLKILNNFDIFTTIGSDLKVEIEKIDELNRDIRSTRITFNYFSAFRQTQITHSTNTCSLDDYINSAKTGYDTNLSQAFEQYLVNIKIEKSLAITERSDQTYAEKIDQWFKKLDNDLKFIFEDDSTSLFFDYKTKKFLINQHKKTFNFQNLSSGYSSIFIIYAELMMRSQLLNILPDELNGIVLIDEIDAHLHISLQRKILPFFIKSFPNIQFIVTTHSPFVITSANDDTVIFDLTNGNFIDENLSSYSVESITQELLHVNTESLDLKKSIDYIYESINSENIDFEILNSELKKLQPYKSKLNIESKSIYMQGLNFLIDNDKLGDLDV